MQIIKEKLDIEEILNKKDNVVKEKKSITV